MRSVFLSLPVLAILRKSARAAAARADLIRVDDVIAALLDDSIGPLFTDAIAAPDFWPPVDEPSEPEDGAMYVLIDGGRVGVSKRAEKLFSSGARQVFLDTYEPRHLAAAIGETATALGDPLAKFRIDPPAWRKSLSRIP